MLKPICSLILILVLSFVNVFSQNQNCNGTRYYADVFSNYKVTYNVVYGENTTVRGLPFELKMDVYEPKNDPAPSRPAVIVIHGGGFTQGAKDDIKPVALCESFAKKGYVAISISYRTYDLYPVIPDSTSFADAVVKAASDLKAAVRFLREDAATINRFKIDPDYIFAGGGSAGGSTAMHAAYLDDVNEAPAYIKQLITSNGGLRGNSSDNFEYSDAIQGVFSASGGMLKPNFIDSNDPPIMCIHANGDGAVPYNAGPIYSDNFYVGTFYGSLSVHNRAQSVGVPSELITVNANYHTNYFADPVWYDSLVNTAAATFYTVICQGSPTPKTDVMPNIGHKVYPNPADETFIIEISDVFEQDVVVNLYNQQGQKVRSTNFNWANNINIHREGLSPGVYIVETIVRDKFGVFPLYDKIFLK